LIEILVAALMLVVIILGVLYGFDVSGKESVVQRQYLEAQDIAQQTEDQLVGEKLSELQGAGLYNVQNFTQTVDGTTYSVGTGVVFESLQGQSVCTDSNTQVTYAKLSTYVTWPTMPKQYPIEAERYVSLSGTGGLIVHVSNFDTSTPWTSTNGTNDVLIWAGNGASSFATTDSNGCAVFPGLDASTYEVAANNYGNNPTPENWVTDTIQSGTNTFNTQPPDQYVTVTASSTPAVVNFIFAQESSITTSFQSNGSTAAGDSIMLTNTSEPSPTPLAFPTYPVPSTSLASPAAPPAASTVTAGGLFPFSEAGNSAIGSPYTVYAGTCTADQPSTVNSANTNPTVAVDENTANNVTVQVPPVTLKIYSGTSSASPGTVQTVVPTEIWMTDTGCNYIRGYTSSAGQTAASSSTAGALNPPALPFGTYTACVAENVTSAGANTSNTWEAKTASFTNSTNGGVIEKLYWGSATQTTGLC
jgi:hypothetical protein